MMLFGLSLASALLSANALQDAETEPLVAAISYTGNTAPDGSVDCEEIAADDLEEEVCESEVLVRDAADRGAKIIVLSEGAFEIENPEALPRVGRVPDPDRAPILYGFAALADELDVYLMVPMHTEDSDGHRFSSLAAFSPRGRTLAVHHKVELYSEEHEEYEAGRHITTFDTPWGRIAMLLCSDLYADPELHVDMIRSGATIVALSSMWTVSEAARWQAALAHDWGVFVIAANGAGGRGRGSGIYAPGGVEIDSDDSGTDVAVVGPLRSW